MQVNTLEINGSLVPDQDDTFDLGNSTLRWQDIFLSGKVYAADINLGWTNLTNYPTGCSAGQAVQVIGDTLTCVNLNSTGNLTGTGTANTITKWITSSTLGNSNITDDGTIVAIDTSDLYLNTSSGLLGLNT